MISSRSRIPWWALVGAARTVLIDHQLMDGAYAFATDSTAGDFRVGRRIDF